MLSYTPRLLVVDTTAAMASSTDMRVRLRIQDAHAARLGFLCAAIRVQTLVILTLHSLNWNLREQGCDNHRFLKVSSMHDAVSAEIKSIAATCATCTPIVEA